jgi:hypothetical protein
MRVHNRLVRSSSKTVAVVVTLIGISSGSAFVDVGAGAKAMACCAKARRSCAGLRTPDQCCKRMHPAPADPLAGTVTAKRIVPIAVAATLSATPDLGWFDPFIPYRHTDSKRPHDPPHLHTFSLLI